MSVCSDGKHYDVPEGLIFSFPCTVKDGKWEIVEGLTLDDRSKGFFAATIRRDCYVVFHAVGELQEEKAAAEAYLASQ